MKTLIFTLVNAGYEGYVPLFKYCIKEAWPKGECVPAVASERNASPVQAACLRHLADMEEYGFSLDGIDSVLITDVDICMMRENLSISSYHLTRMWQNKTECYDNYTVTDKRDRPLCCGVNFVTREWFCRTRKERSRLKEALNIGELKKDDDEAMLYCIVKDSGLVLPKDEMNTDFAHGLHLGKFRRYVKLNYRPKLTPNESIWLRKLFKDECACEYLKKMRKTVAGFEKTYNLMKSYL